MVTKATAKDHGQNPSVRAWLGKSWVRRVGKAWGCVACQNQLHKSCRTMHEKRLYGYRSLGQNCFRFGRNCPQEHRLDSEGWARTFFSRALEHWAHPLIKHAESIAMPGKIVATPTVFDPMRQTLDTGAHRFSRIKVSLYS